MQLQLEVVEQEELFQVQDQVLQLQLKLLDHLLFLDVLHQQVVEQVNSVEVIMEVLEDQVEEVEMVQLEQVMLEDLQYQKEIQEEQVQLQTQHLEVAEQPLQEEMYLQEIQDQ